MAITGITQLAVYVVSALFLLAGTLNLSGVRAVRAVYRFWHYRRSFHRTIGVLELVTALFLIVPQLRVWGLVLAAPITFFSVVTLLNHRQYLWSLFGMLLLVSLVPVSLA
jgi:hypothetical protein